MVKNTLLLTIIVITAAAFSGCATTTTIVSNPPGASVERNGQVLGQTPLRYESKMWMWETETVNITSTAGEKKTVELKRSEIDMVPAVGSVGLVCCFGLTLVGLAGIPLFWAAGFKFPETTTVTFDQRPAALPSRRPGLAMATRRSKDGVVY